MLYYYRDTTVIIEWNVPGCMPITIVREYDNGGFSEINSNILTIKTDIIKGLR